jgi:hypothetical protein
MMFHYRESQLESTVGVQYRVKCLFDRNVFLQVLLLMLTSSSKNVTNRNDFVNVLAVFLEALQVISLLSRLPIPKEIMKHS